MAKAKDTFYVLCGRHLKQIYRKRYDIYVTRKEDGQCDVIPCPLPATYEFYPHLVQIMKKRKK